MRLTVALLLLVLLLAVACERKGRDSNTPDDSGSSEQGSEGGESKVQKGVANAVDGAGEGIKKGAEATEGAVNEAADAVSGGLQSGADAIDDTFGGGEKEKRK